MRRLVALVLLLTALGWQALALGQQHVLALGGGDSQHLVMHWQEEAHHHHADGGLHVDDSSESAAHLQFDHHCCSAALPPSQPQQTLVLKPEDSLLPTVAGRLTRPFLDGPLRPPQATA